MQEMPIPGVSVVKGTNFGTQTDFDGNLQLKQVRQILILATLE
jgi:hypothetical protein